MKKLRILPGRVVKDILRGGMSWVNSHPKLRQYVMAITQRLGLYTVVRVIYSRLEGAPYQPRSRKTSGLTSADLSPRARQIYTDLKATIELKRRKNG